MEEINIWEKTNTLEKVSEVIDKLNDITKLWRYKEIASETYAATIINFITYIQKEMEVNIKIEQKTGKKI